MTDINLRPTRILRLPDVIVRTGLCRASIYERMANGSFPRSIPLGIRARGWLEEEIEAWLAVNIRARQKLVRPRKPRKKSRIKRLRRRLAGMLKRCLRLA